MPVADRIAEVFPPDDPNPPDSDDPEVIGNDNCVTTEKNCDIYDKRGDMPLVGPGGTPIDIQLAVGTIFDRDEPTYPGVKDWLGDPGDQIGGQLQMREFVRLQIGNNPQQGYKNWYRISDWGLWRITYSLKFDAATSKFEDNANSPGVSAPDNNNW
jgi:hypothetical protein